MRIVSLFLALCFSLNVMASTGTIQQLEKSLNEYQYSLSVEWDQKDQAFYDARTQEFFGKIEKLIKEDGLTKEEILAFASLKAKNKELIDALKLKLSLLDKNVSAEELSRVVAEVTNDLYSKGASWNGEILFPVIGIIIVVAVLGYSYWWDANHECVKTESVYTCNTYDSCTGMSVGGLRNPYHAGPIMPNPSCIGFPITHCGWGEACTEYVKK